MDQLEFPLLARIDAPATVPTQWLRQATTYREAVRLAWKLGRIKSLPRANLAAHLGRPSQHASDYLNPDDKPTRRSLPAESIADFEDLVGNSLVSQWLAARSKLTVLEEMQATRLVA